MFHATRNEWYFGLVLLLLAGAALADGVPGQVGETARLYAEPSGSATVITELASGTEVERLDRRDGWVQVHTLDAATNQGWIRIWQFRETAPAEATESGGVLSGLQRFSRAATGLFASEPEDEDADVTVAIGTRGLGIGEAARATPDPAARAQVDGYRVDAATARQHAAKAGLVP